MDPFLRGLWSVCWFLPPAGLNRPLPCREGTGGTTGVCGGHCLSFSLSLSLLISSILRWSLSISCSSRFFSPCSRFLSPTAWFRASCSSGCDVAPAPWWFPTPPSMSWDTRASRRLSLVFRPSTSGPAVCGQLASAGLGTVKVYRQRPPLSFPLHMAARSCAAPRSRRPQMHKRGSKNILMTLEKEQKWTFGAASRLRISRFLCGQVCSSELSPAAHRYLYKLQGKEGGKEGREVKREGKLGGGRRGSEVKREAGRKKLKKFSDAVLGTKYDK